jgi:16S rRNA (cytidine1402-2'-O)-methyltransferase
MNHRTEPVSAGLYLVSTPIGNARDITLRALDLLAVADVIAAEDTRSARKLMEIHGIPLRSRRIVAYHDHSGAEVRDRLIAAVAEGKSVVYASEAGTPLVADPGFALVRAAIAAGVPVTAAPGVTAVVTALSLAGLPSDRFLFAGFLPSAGSARRTAIAELAAVPATLCLYESPKRLAATLADLAAGLGGGRRAVVARELTKRFEELRRGTLEALAHSYDGVTVKGEIVILIDRAMEGSADPEAVDNALREALATMRIKDAAETVSGALGLPRRDVYQRALALSKLERDS